MSARREQTDLEGWLHPSVREVFRDDALWVLDKPAGLLSHPNPPADRAPNAILRAPYDMAREVYRVATPDDGACQVFLAHRLDQETSGLILCAFREDAAVRLKEALFHREVIKEYRALLLGCPHPSEGEWEDALKKSSEGRRVVVRPCGGRPNARVRYRVLEHLEEAGLSLVSLRPDTGRTHQLRVQTAHRGFPIAGDARYGDFTSNRFLAAEIGLKHMFLHAIRLEVRHPLRGHRLKLQAPLTARLAGPLERARELGRKVPRRPARRRGR